MNNIANVIILVLYGMDAFLLVPKYVKCKYDHTPRKEKLIWKGLCIAIPVFVLTALIAKQSMYEDVASYVSLLMAGMILCAFGDIVLEIKFFLGGILFFAGHFVYVITLFEMGTNWIALLVYPIIAGLGMWLTYKYLGKKYRLPLWGYNFIISGSFSLGFALVVTAPLAGKILGTGMVFLVASDWLLARNKLYKSSYFTTLLYLELYFVGQMMISAFLLF